MDIEIPCRAFGRLARISRTLPPTERREWLRSVFVERIDNHAWIGSTDSTFAGIYYLGPSNGDDGFVIIKHDGVLLDSLEQSDVDVKFRITDTPILGWCGVTTPNGYTTQGDAAIRDPEAIATFKKWRDWFPHNLAEQPGRSMYLEADRLHKLVESCPSGRIVFPQIIDAEKPVIVRDHYDPCWMGIFFARPCDGLHVKGAQLPEWVK